MSKPHDKFHYCKYCGMRLKNSQFCGLSHRRKYLEKAGRNSEAVGLKRLSTTDE